MLTGKKPFTFDRVVRLAITGGILWGIIWLLGYLSTVLIPFVIALLLAYLMNPLVLLVQKKFPTRSVAVLISLLLIVALISLLGLITIPLIVEELSDTGRGISHLVNNSDVAEQASKHLPPDLWRAIKEFFAKERIQEFFTVDSFWTLVDNLSRKLLPGVWGIVTGTASFLIGLVGMLIIGIYLVFLLIDFENVQEEWKELIPPNYRGPVLEFVHDFNETMHRYFRGQAAIASLVGIMAAVGFKLIGLPMGILLGLFVGLLNMVPYLQVLGFIPAFFLVIIHAGETGKNFWGVLGLTLLVFAVVQAIQESILIPKIMGKVMRLNPAVILLSLSVWGKLLGFFGLLLALPLTFLLLTYYRRFLASVAVQEIPEEGGV